MNKLWAVLVLSEAGTSMCCGNEHPEEVSLCISMAADFKRNEPKAN